MNNNIIKAVVVCTLWQGLSSCHNKEKTDDVKFAFTMSDTMMSRCQFTKASESDVKTELKLFGKIAADNNKQAQVYPVVGGVVEKINVELGDYVQQGQVLAVVRSSEVAEFQKERLDAQSDLMLAEKNLRVAKDLYEGKLNSERDVLAADKEVEKARASVNRINEVYQIYNIKKGSIYNITAPLSGFIVQKDINQNEQLRSDKSDLVFAIAQIDDIWVLANVNESDIGKIKEGYEADIMTVSYPDKLFTGKVDKIFNAIDPQTRAMKVRIKIANPDFLLKPEMNATVTLKFSENKKMVTVPSSSVIFDNSRAYVMVFKSKSVIETRQVEVYRQLNDVTYLSSGVNEGETVISKNGLLIYDALND